MPSFKTCIPYDEYHDLKKKVVQFWDTHYNNLVERLKEFDGLKQYYVPHYIPIVQVNRYPDPFPSFIKKSILYSDLIVFYDPYPTLASSFYSVYEDTKRWEPHTPQNNTEEFYFYDESPLGVWRFTKSLVQYSTLLQQLEEYIREGFITILPGIDYNRGIYIPKIDGRIFDLLEEKILLYLKDCFHLEAVVSTDDDLAWYYIKENLNQFKSKQKDLIALSALQELDLKYLNEVTLKFALEMRKGDYISQFRAYLRRMFGDIQSTSSLTDFQDTVNNYKIEINDEIRRCENEFNQISKLAAARMITMTALAIGGVTMSVLLTNGLSLPDWYVYIAATGITSGTIWDIIREFFRYKERTRPIRRSNVYLLYKLKKTANKK